MKPTLWGGLVRAVPGLAWAARLLGRVERVTFGGEQPETQPPPASDPGPDPRAFLAEINRWTESEELGEAVRSVRSPRFPRGISARVGVKDILRSQTRLVHLARHISGLSDDEYAGLVLATLVRFAGWVGLLPASRDNHHAEAGGLFRHSLHAAILASQMSEGVVFSRTGTPEQIRRNRSRWRLAAFMGGLFHDIGKTAALYEVYADTECSRGRWVPQAGPLAEWCAENGLSEYFLKWRDGTDEMRVGHQRFNEMLFAVIAPQALVAYLSDSEPDNVLDALMRCLAGNGGSVLARVVAEADGESCRQYLRERPAGSQTDEGAGYPEKRCFAALRLLIADGRLKVNEPGGGAWFVSGCLFLEWTESLYALIRERLARDGARGIPADREAMLRMLSGTGMIALHDRRTDEGDVYRTPLWTISVEAEGAVREISHCVFIANRADLLPPQIESLPGFIVQGEPGQGSAGKDVSRAEKDAAAEPGVSGGGVKEVAASGGDRPREDGRKPDRAEPLDAMPRADRAAAVAETVRSALGAAGLLGREREGEERRIFWSDFPALAALGAVRAVSRENFDALGLTEEECRIAESLRAVLPAELPRPESADSPAADLRRQAGRIPYLGPLMRLKHLRESVPGASDVAGRVGEMAPVWVALAACVQNQGRHRLSTVEIDRAKETVCVRSLPKFLRAHGANEAEGSGGGERNARILSRLRDFGEDVRDPAVIFRDRLTYLAVSYLASMDGNMALRATAIERLRAVFAGERDPGTPLPEHAAHAKGAVTVRAVDALPGDAGKAEDTEKDRENNDVDGQAQEKAQGYEPPRPEPGPEPARAAARTSEPDSPGEDGKEPASAGVKPAIKPAVKSTVKREFAREFAAEMDRAAPVIGGRQTAIERKGEELSVRVIPTAISGFLAEKGLSRRDIERVRLQQFSEYKLKELGITILRPSDGRAVMELEKRVKVQS